MKTITSPRFGALQLPLAVFVAQFKEVEDVFVLHGQFGLLSVLHRHRLVEVGLVEQVRHGLEQLVELGQRHLGVDRVRAEAAALGVAQVLSHELHQAGQVGAREAGKQVAKALGGEPEFEKEIYPRVLFDAMASYPLTAAKVADEPLAAAEDMDRFAAAAPVHARFTHQALGLETQALAVPLFEGDLLAGALYILRA